MTKLPLLIAASGAMLAVPAAPSLAQTSQMGEIIVYGNDPCPRQTDDEVVICRRLGEEERYRIPENMRTSGPPQERDSWVNRSRPLMTAGNTGINSCSSVGPGGQTGCLLQEINENERANREAQERDTPPED